MFYDSKIYNDTVEIVKSAVGSSGDNFLNSAHADTIIANYIKAVFNALKEINSKCKD